MPKVLIVDDEEDILWGLSEELSRNGIDVDTASNGQEAFEKIKENDYDFLITDIRMPGMSGSELLLKSKNLRPDLKVVVMTAYGSDELKQEVLSHGAISYLEKPFDFEQLLELIKEKGKKVDETISKLSLNQFMQLVSMEGQSCTITVKTDEGEGKVYFIDGEVVNAEFQNFIGEEAFIKIMKFPKPAFDVDWGVPQTKRMIEKPLHALLLAAVAKKEEEEAGISAGSDELSEEEVDLSALTELFGEDEGVSEEGKEEIAEEELTEEPVTSEDDMEISLEGISFDDEGVVEEDMVEEVIHDKVSGENEIDEEEFSIENIESMLEEEVSEADKAEEFVEEVQNVETESGTEDGLKEEFSLENLESMLEEEVAEEEKKEEALTEEGEESKSLTEEEVVDLESLEEKLEELVDVTEPEQSGEPEEKKAAEEATDSALEELEALESESEVSENQAEVMEEEVVEGEEAAEGEISEEEAAEEAEQEEEKAEENIPEPSIQKKGEPVISDEKRPIAEEILRKIVALTTDIHAGFIADVNGNIIASQYKTGSVKGESLGHLGEYVGMMFEILKQVTGEEIEDMILSLKSENIIAAPALDGTLAIFVVTTKRTMKLALIKVELRKAVSKLKEELS